MSSFQHLNEIYIFCTINMLINDHINIKYHFDYLYFILLGAYTRESKEVFEFVNKLITQAKRKCKYLCVL